MARRKTDLNFWRPPRPQTGTVTLDRHSIFILPSRHGLLAFIALFVMFLGAVNYSSNLAFGLIFWFGSIMLLSILHTFRNLNGLQVRCESAAPVFAGDTTRFRVVLENPGSEAKLALALQQNGSLQDHCDIAAHAQAVVLLCVSSSRRGHLTAPWFQLYTRHPFGLFHAWSRLNLPSTTLVYPRPAEQRLPLPPSSRHIGQERRLSPEQEDDFHGLRNYVPGDTPARIAWKALASERGLYSKTYDSPLGDELWLNWQHFAPLDTEARLQQLAAWVLQLEQSQQPYGLQLPHLTLPPALGEAHRQRCLEALALFPT